MALHYGAGRQIGSFDFHQTGHAYDGIRLRATVDKALVVDVLSVRLRRDIAQPDRQRVLYGVLATARPTGSLLGDIYLLVLDDGTPDGRQRLQTMGLRLDWRPFGVVEAEIESAVQIGNRIGGASGESDRFATMVVARLGAFGTAGIPFGGGVGFDRYSGDDDMTDGVDRAWRPLYGDLDVIVGLLQRFSPSNLRTALAWLEAGPRDGLHARVDIRLIEQLRAASTAETTSSGWQAAGAEIDGKAQYAPWPGQSLSIGAGVFVPTASPVTGKRAGPVGLLTFTQWRGRF